MSEHWIVENKRWGHGGLRVVTDASAAAQYSSWRGWEVTGPFIAKPPLADLIERCDGWIKSLDFYATTHDGSPEMVVAVAVEMRAELARLRELTP
jgi:hypothetical protein